MLAHVALFSLLLAPQAEVDNPLPPGTAIEFAAQTMTGNSVSSNTLKGAACVILVWGAWSQPSVRTLDLARELRVGGRKIRFIALASWDTKDAVAAALETDKSGAEVWWDPAGRDRQDSIATKVFKTRRFPTIYVMNSSMLVLKGFVGYRATDRDALFAAIDSAE